MNNSSNTQAQEELYLLETTTDYTFNKTFQLDQQIISCKQSTNTELDVIKQEHPSRIGTKDTSYALSMDSSGSHPPFATNWLNSTTSILAIQDPPKC